MSVRCTVSVLSTHGLWRICPTARIARSFSGAVKFRYIFDKSVRDTIWLTADVHYTAAHYYDPNKAQFQDFDPFWEFVAGPIHAGTFGPSPLDPTFGPEATFQWAPEPGKANLAPWDGLQSFGTVDVTREDSTGGDTAQRLRYTTSFLWMCQGYYNHTKPYLPRWEGMDRFHGMIVHPQQWQADLDLTGKRVVVIGSGATAATLIPAIAGKAEHVTMLQRSPSYYFAPPANDPLAVELRALDIPEEWTHEILRRKFTAQMDLLARMSMESPSELHGFLIESMRPLLPDGFDVDKHFTPRYRPWQQRIAIVPDGDLFAALREGTASVVTDTIETFTEHGIKVSSGEEIPADIIVSATGFNLSLFGDVAFAVDDEPVDFTERVTWRGIMISGVPNMAYVFGYFRHSWTLRVDLVCDLLARLLAGMRDKGATMVTPELRPEEADMPLLSFADPDNFNAGYVMRTQHLLYKRGDREPWTHLHEHEQERDILPKADLDDGTLLYR